ncbi:hypothetical protein ACLRGF_02725 [Mycetocola zhadangensis]|uniref:hypothetical protein n=1 Tax=Mycetocola zhadangensis TaxID=1164595 RepID=UPI003A4E3C92
MPNPDESVPMSPKSDSGLSRVLISTAVAGGAGFVIQVGVGVLMGPGEQYLAFSVFWAALYLLIGALSGIQQEVSRSAAQSIEAGRGAGADLWHFVAISGAIVVVLVGATSLVWGRTVFGEQVVSAVVFLVSGALGYVILASQSGVMYGTRQWNTLAVSIVADPVIRCALLAAAVGFGLGTGLVQLAVVLPLFLTAGIVGFALRRFGAAVRLDVGIRTLLWNVSRAVVGSAATAILVSGFPLFLKVGLHATAPELLATIIFVINFTRAPIVIPLLALQSYMIVSFSRDGSRLWKRLTAICGIALGAATMVGAGAFLLSPWVFGTLLGGTYSPNPAFVAYVIAASGLTAALCATGSAALSKSLHGIFSAGWSIAAITTVALLFTPLPPETRVVVALAAGPAVGLVIHSLGLARDRVDKESETPA